MFLGWDVGIKNLSFCLIDFNEEEKQYKIIDWGIINLVKNHLLPNVQCCGTVKSTGKKCQKSSVYVLKNNSMVGYCKAHAKGKDMEILEEFTGKRKCEICGKDASRYDDELDQYLCLKHVPKERKDLVEKISLKASKIPLMQLGKTLYKQLDLETNFSKVEYVIIENQPVLKNPTMKSIQMMLYSYFLKKYITDIEPEKRILKDIVLMSAKNKLKIYDGPALTHINKIKSQYSRNKKLAIEHCKYIIEQDCVDEQWIELFKNSSKKDDLSDAHLMTKYFIMKKFKII